MEHRPRPSPQQLKENVIKEIMSHAEDLSHISLLTFFLTFFPLQLITMGSAVPTGIFVPSILCGCALGGVFGKLMQHHWFTAIHPGSYALMGAVAMLGGIQRTTISLCVIMMEATQETQYLLPIIITTGRGFF